MDTSKDQPVSGWITPFPHCKRVVATRRAIAKARSRKSLVFDNKFAKKCILEELIYYAHVRICERDGRFFLIYNDPEKGTGGFKTRDEAIMWFVRQGR